MVVSPSITPAQDNALRRKRAYLPCFCLAGEEGLLQELATNRPQVTLYQWLAEDDGIILMDLDSFLGWG